MNKKDNKKNPRIVFLDILTGDKDLRKKLDRSIHLGKKYGNIMRKMIKTPIFSFVPVDASLGKFPDFDDFDCLIIGGSVDDPVPGKEKEWMKKTYLFIKKAIGHKKPILGICGGLQFTIRALGGKVIINSNGREFGTIKIKVSKEGRKDKLFKNIPSVFSAQSSHKFMADNSNNNLKIIATSDMCGAQAIAVGENIRLVQFHPEMAVRSMKGLAKMRKKELEKEGIIKKGNLGNFLRSIRQTRESALLIDNFIKYFVIGK